MWLIPRWKLDLPSGMTIMASRPPKIYASPDQPEATFCSLLTAYMEMGYGLGAH